MSKNEQKFLQIFLSFLFIFNIFVIYFVFSGSLILPQTFSLGFFSIRYYGIIMALAVGAGFYLADSRSERFGIKGAAAQNVLFWIIIGGFVGARLYHVLSSLGYYRENILEIFKVWNGGLSIYGAVLGGLIAVLVLAKSYKLQATSLLNWLTPPLVIGQIIGRFGNLFNYEAFGLPTNLPWKMFVPENFRPLAYLNEAYFHPWFLYEQLGLIVILFAIKRMEKPGGFGFPGLFLWYLLLYNTLRFGLEFLRIDSTFVAGFRLNSLVSLILIIISAALIIRQKKLESA